MVRFMVARCRGSQSTAHCLKRGKAMSNRLPSRSGSQKSCQTRCHVKEDMAEGRSAELRPLRIPENSPMCIACWRREGVTTSGTCSPVCHDRTSTAELVQDTHHQPLSPPYGGGRQ